MRYDLVTGAVAFALSLIPAFANGASGAPRAITDQQFLVDAANASITEAALGELAEAGTSNAEVRNFATLMVADHEKALNELRTVARGQHISLPATLDPKDLALENRLDQLSGRALDRAYMTAMVEDHRTDVVEFRAESRNARSVHVRQLAAKALPALLGQLTLAQEIDRSVACP